MHELNVNEIEEVNGGVLAFGAAAGAIAGGGSAWANGGSLGDIVTGAAFGAIGGFFGGAGGIIWGAGSKITGLGIASSGGVVSSLPSFTKH
jgi:hypothetical protein